MATDTPTSPPGEENYSQPGGGALTLRNLVTLTCALVAAKAVVMLGTILLIADGDAATLHYLVTQQGATALVHAIATDWDSVQYLLIAQMGYSTFKGSELYAFSPFYPALTYAAHFLTHSYLLASLLVPNVLSFIFPIIVLRLFGMRAALLAETFPVYVVYSMIAYSDVIALVFLALALLLFVRRRYFLAGVSVGLAGFVFYDLLVAAVVFAAWLLYGAWHKSGRDRRVQVRPLAELLVPVALAGLAILTFYWISTGDPFRFLELEHSYWGVAPTTPVGQIVWIFYGSGTGSFRAFVWNVDGVLISSAYWAVRNAAFEAFFFAGIYLLARMKDNPYRWLLVGYSSLLTLPLLFVQGTPVYSIPRLMLVAFPVFLGYSAKLIDRPWRIALYIGFSLLSACWVLMTFTFAFFA